MVRIAMVHDPADYNIYGADTGSACVEGRREASFVPPVVGAPLLLTLKEIDGPHELSPSDHLTKKPLQRIHMDRALRTNTQRLLDHFRRREEADIQQGVNTEWKRKISLSRIPSS